jgi:hypothetical protein
MGLNRLRSHAFAFVAAVAAISLAVSAVPASATAAVGSTHTATYHSTDGHTFRTPDITGDTICLRNDDSVCLATNGSDVPGTDHIDWVLVIQAVKAAIELWWLRKEGESTETSGEGDQGGDETTAGDCAGDSGESEPVEFTSCESAHGTYWQFQPFGDGYRIWNTYTHGFLEVPNTENGTAVRTGSTSDDWSTWVVLTDQ